MSNAAFQREALSRAQGPQDKWTGSNPKEYMKLGPSPCITNWGRKAILERWDSGIRSPLRIAVQLGIPNRIVQIVLAGLRDRNPDFTDHEYFQHISPTAGFVR